jgi:hypothetical protein
VVHNGTMPPVRGSDAFWYAPPFAPPLRSFFAWVSECGLSLHDSLPPWLEGGAKCLSRRAPVIMSRGSLEKRENELFRLCDAEFFLFFGTFFGPILTIH